jgi:hypothetical protein
MLAEQVHWQFLYNFESHFTKPDKFPLYSLNVCWEQDLCETATSWQQSMLFNGGMFLLFSSTYLGNKLIHCNVLWSNIMTRYSLLQIISYGILSCSVHVVVNYVLSSTFLYYHCTCTLCNCLLTVHSRLCTYVDMFGQKFISWKIFRGGLSGRTLEKAHCHPSITT